MKELENLVEHLFELESVDKDKQIKTLQQINEKLLTEYVIKIGDVTIEPILVEEYYYHKDKFCDKNTHGYGDKGIDKKCRKLQSNRFNQLYFHEKGYGGVDICLSTRDDYCLSFLIKNSIVSDVGFCKQTHLYDFMKKELTQKLKITFEELKNTKNILCKKHRDYEIVHTVRKGLTKGSFKNEKLASLPIEIIKEYSFTLEKGHSKTVLIKDYLNNESSKPTHKKSIAELEELSKNYMPSKEFKILFGK